MERETVVTRQVTSTARHLAVTALGLAVAVALFVVIGMFAGGLVDAIFGSGNL